MIMIFRSYGSLEDIRYNINCTYIPAQKIFRSFHNFADEIVDIKYIKLVKNLIYISDWVNSQFLQRLLNILCVRKKEIYNTYRKWNKNHQ